MRFRVSVLKGTGCVREKGSALMVTDSNATARVVVAWLSRTGFLLVAASAVEWEINRTHEKIKLFAAQHGRLIFIKEWAPSRFPK